MANSDFPLDEGASSTRFGQDPTGIGSIVDHGGKEVVIGTAGAYGVYGAAVGGVPGAGAAFGALGGLPGVGAAVLTVKDVGEVAVGGMMGDSEMQRDGMSGLTGSAIVGGSCAVVAVVGAPLTAGGSLAILPLCATVGVAGGNVLGHLLKDNEVYADVVSGASRLVGVEDRFAPEGVTWAAAPGAPARGSASVVHADITGGAATAAARVVENMARSDAGRAVSRTVEGVVRDVARSDAGRAVERTVRDVGTAVNRTTDDAARAAARGLRDVQEAADSALNNTTRAVGDFLKGLGR